jgi:hypothetical protein
VPSGERRSANVQGSEEELARIEAQYGEEGEAQPMPAS